MNKQGWDGQPSLLSPALSHCILWPVIQDSKCLPVRSFSPPVGKILQNIILGVKLHGPSLGGHWCEPHPHRRMLPSWALLCSLLHGGALAPLYS